MGRARVERRRASQDSELNIASVIDTLTVLIIYLLVSVSFVSIGALDVGNVAAAVARVMNQGDRPRVDIQVQLNQDHSIAIDVRGTEKLGLSVAPRNDGWDLDTMSNQLATLKQRWPEVTSAIISADAAVEYRQVVQAIEKMRATFGSIAMGASLHSRNGGH